MKCKSTTTQTRTANSFSPQIFKALEISGDIKNNSKKNCS